MTQEQPGISGYGTISVVLTALITVAALALQLPFPVNHDAAWILLGADRMLDGARFGRDVVDVNPPLAWWVSVPAVVLSRAFGLPLAGAFQIYVFLLGAGSVALCLASLAWSGLDRVVRSIALPFLAAAFWLLPAYDFGQREHLMVVMCAPLVLQYATRSLDRETPVWALVLCAVMAAIGFCLKPHFLIIPAGLTCLLVWHTRRLSSAFTLENFVIAGFAVLYLTGIWLLAPGYIHDVVPDALSNYGAYAMAWRDIFLRYAIIAAPLIVAGAFAAWPTSGTKLPRQAIYLFAAAGFSACAALLQAKGWSYHLLPAVAFGLAGTGLAIANMLTGRSGGLRVLIATMLLAVTTLFPLSSHVSNLTSPTGNYSVTQAVVAEIEATPKAPVVFAFITSPRNVHPAVLETGAKWLEPACCLHFLPAHIRDVADGTADDASRGRRAVALKQVDRIVARLISSPPDVILVDDNRAKLGLGVQEFDYLPWLHKQPGFASLWQHYEETGRAGHFRVFRRRAD